MEKLDKTWRTVKTNYKLVKLIGEGSNGMVVKAIHRVNKIPVAIKRVACSFDNLPYMKYLLREITIMR